MKIENIREFETLDAQLKAVYSEIEALSKKKPNEVLNEFKLGFINSLLKNINKILSEPVGGVPIRHRNYTNR